MSQNVINNSYVIGVGQRNLVLNTLGRVYVKKQDKYYELNIGNIPVSSTETQDVPDIVVVNTEQDALALTYPGDNKLVVGLDGSLFICSNGAMTKLNITPTTPPSQPIIDVIDGQLTINYPDGSPLILNNNPLFPAFIINGNALIAGLNAEYLNGLKGDAYAVKGRNETITGQWYFNNNISLNGSIGDGNTYFDTKTSTLVVDNLIVRNQASMPNTGSESIDAEYHIFGTNEETWIGKEFLIDSMTLSDATLIPNPSTTVDEFTGDYYEAVLKVREQSPFPDSDYVDLSQFVSKDSVLRSSRTYYKVVDFDSVNYMLYLRTLPSGGFEDDLKLVVIGHTSDTGKKGGIHMNSIVNKPPYLDVTNDYKYDYSENPVTSESTLNTIDNLQGRFGNLDGLPEDDILGTYAEQGTLLVGKNVNIFDPSPIDTFTKDDILAYGKTIKSGNYIKNAHISFGDSGLMLPDGSGYISTERLIWTSKYLKLQDVFIRNGDTININPDGSGKIGKFEWDENGDTITSPGSGTGESDEFSDWTEAVVDVGIGWYLKWAIIPNALLLQGQFIAGTWPDNTLTFTIENIPQDILLRLNGSLSPYGGIVLPGISANVGGTVVLYPAYATTTSGLSITLQSLGINSVLFMNINCTIPLSPI